MTRARSTVLIVDDDEGVRFVLSEALRMWDYNVVEAENAINARAVFARERPAAIVTDINLPDGSGLDLLREFKRHDPSTVVIVITGELIIENTISALRGDADDFISKPIDIHELQLALNSSLVDHALATPPSKLRVLIFADTDERSRDLRAVIDPAEATIAEVTTVDELVDVCREPHEIVVIDVEPASIGAALRTARASELHYDVPLLVSSENLVTGVGLAGLLPRYRAMPCSMSEMASLVHRRAQVLSHRMTPNRRRL